MFACSPKKFAYRLPFPFSRGALTHHRLSANAHRCLVVPAPTSDIAHAGGTFPTAPEPLQFMVMEKRTIPLLIAFRVRGEQLAAPAAWMRLI
jgi:hypothetical protein